jgi:hypothetical protein
MSSHETPPAVLHLTAASHITSKYSGKAMEYLKAPATERGWLSDGTDEGP